MTWFHNLRFRNKLLIPIALIAVLTLILAMQNLRSSHSMATTVDHVIHLDLPGVNYLLQADRDFHQVWVAERSLMNLKVGSPEYQQVQAYHQENLEQIKERVNKFAALPLPTELSQRLDSFWPAFAQWSEITQRIVTERSSDTRAGRSTAMDLSYNEGLLAFETARGYLDQMTEIILTLSDQTSQRVVAQQQSALHEQIALSAVTLLACAGVALFFPGLIVQDITRMIARVKALSQGDGDLTVRLSMKRKDELGQLATALDSFIDHLHNMVRQLLSTTQDINVNAQELGELSQSASQVVARQGEAISHVVSSIDEVSHSISRVAENTSQTTEETRHTQTEVASGEAQVAQSQRDISQLTSNVSQAVEAISKIQTVSKRIGSVLGVINGIAEQTNLLALNAAIEAARAGEAGRGFAVVADEVRALASKTQQSTNDIQDMISELESSVSGAVTTMATATENADKTLESSSLTSHSIQAVQSSITNVNGLTEQIADAAKQQSRVMTTIHQHMTTLDRLSKESAESTTRVSASSQVMNQLAEALNQVTARFRV
ncbi:methyl-accepting chemotaxis protein [Pokkaliibacter sp. MBI-7]|uniref:methyl-accepting chemotaxis protein n=1 Tax=Pokkaliibacter sp. MBI-7 TaxID=3040600 RepID=UPI002447D5AB|nr:methyl-accepting chemotaxis protein [Pokkaliibacter sp. MBI-7]MDH2431088.1 methyl-accepting chemotaxis protein [Pokkaliibacter sp. MBI-7]